jgi:hypothetical protein
VVAISGGCPKSYETVKYDDPYSGPMVAVSFPETEPRKEPKDLQQVTVKNIDPGARLDIKGTVKFPSPDKWEPIVIDVFTVNAKGIPVSANTGIGMPKELNGVCRYQVTLKAPMKPGRYFAHARCGTAFVGNAELFVRKPH